MSLKQGKKIKNSILYNYVPYAFHYNHQSILTKNGELIFVLKLENRFDDHFKEIIVKNFSLKSFAPYAIWITTINEEIKNENFFNNDNIQKNESLESKINQIFSSNLPKKTKEFSQEIFISFIFNDDVNISDLKFNLASLINFSQNNYTKRLSFLYMKSMAVLSNFIYNLKKYNPKILGIFEEKEALYCQILNFLSKINFLPSQDKVPLDSKDLSFYLNKINNFEFKILNQNVIKIKNLEKEKYISVFSCKSNENYEFNSGMTTEILDNEFDFISTEVLINVQKKEILDFKQKSLLDYDKKFYEQVENFDIIENNEILKEFFNYSKNLKKKTNELSSDDFVLKKNIISIKAESLEDLNFFSKKLFDKISYKGYRISRENIFLDQIFWCQLPGNFNFFDKIYLVNKKNTFFLNDFKSYQNKWLDSFVLKNKTNNSVNKINFGQKKVFFCFDDRNSLNLLFFLIYISKDSNLLINVLNYTKDKSNLFQNQEFNRIKEKKGAEYFFDEKEGSVDDRIIQEPKIKEIFEIIFIFLKILWFGNFYFIESKIYQVNDPNLNEFLDKLKNLAKKITIEINKNIKSINYKIIIKIFNQFNILTNQPDIIKKLNLLNNNIENFSFINFFCNKKEEINNDKIMLIFTLVKIIEQSISKKHLNLSIVFFLNIDDIDQFENFDLMIKEISLILKKQNIFLFINFNKENIRAILKIYNKIYDHISIFAHDLCGQEAVKFLNPNFSADQSFFKNLLIIINDLKFFLNDFPNSQINNIIFNEKSI